MSKKRPKENFFKIKKNSVNVMAESWIGKRPYICNTCGGSGETGRYKKTMQCMTCKGKGTVNCFGLQQCPKCHGKKIFTYIIPIICKPCEGAGTLWR